MTSTLLFGSCCCGGTGADSGAGLMSVAGGVGVGDGVALPFDGGLR